MLAELAMERTPDFEVRFYRRAAAGSRPVERPAASTRSEFFVSPNPGEELRPLAPDRSPAGELSRVMLAIKTLTATSRHGFSDAVDRVPSLAAPWL